MKGLFSLSYSPSEISFPNPEKKILLMTITKLEFRRVNTQFNLKDNTVCHEEKIQRKRQGEYKEFQYRKNTGDKRQDKGQNTIQKRRQG